MRKSRSELNDTIAQLLEAGLTRSGSALVMKALPKPVRSKGVGVIKIDDIEGAIAADRE